MNDEPIMFSSRSAQYEWLSNFYLAPIQLTGRGWPSVEHYFQAQKFIQADMRERIAGARTPQAAKALGRSRKSPIRADWEEGRIDVMRTAVAAKFEQHEDLASRLRTTAPRLLIEDNPHDAFWGRGPDGTGQNRLGVLLMSLRRTI